MTRNQWKVFEDSLHLAPEIVTEMYKPDRMELTESESVDLARVVRTSAMALTLASQPNVKISQQELEMLVDTTISTIAGLYGRVMGLAKAYDEAITKQTVLEAELATTGK